MKKADIFLILAILLLAGASQLAIFGFAKDSDTVTVTVDGKEYGTYSLYQDQNVEIVSGNNYEDFNYMVIEHGAAKITNANCGSKDCVHQGAISKPGQSIVCLPHKVVVTVNGKTDDVDMTVSLGSPLRGELARLRA